LDSFDDRYLGAKTADPTVDNDGNALVTGALYYRTTTPVGMKVYDGAQWIEASAAQQSLMVTYEFVATAGQTTFSGTDANGATLSYVANSISVSLNGVTLRPGDDYTATNGTSVVLNVAAALNDDLMVIAFAVFNVANAVAKTGDTMTGSLLLPAGTVSAPALTTSADTNTGIFFPAADTVAIGTGGTEALRVNSAQNVGVGTTSPTAASSRRGLVLRGNANGAELIVQSTSATDGTSDGFSLTTVGTDAYLFNRLNGFTAFATNNAERARIDSSGNLLVGATSLPTSSVSVAGVGVFNASGTAGRINLGKTASGTLDGLANYHNGTYVGGITYSNTATALVASSDERLKENITAAPPALEKAMSIEVVSYDWKHDPTHVEFGLVAQRLNSIYSEAVNVGDDGEEVEKTWGVEYGRLTPMLLKAIQEQQQMIETLQAKVAALEGKK
jgi:hypothetical protein